MKTGKKQHTNPRFYLNQFIHPGWVYLRGSQQPKRTQSARGEAVKEWYYSQDKDEKGHSLDSINTYIEGYTAPILQELLISKDGLPYKSKWLFSHFIANLALRVPAYIEEMSETMVSALEQVDDMVKKITEKRKIEVAEDKPYIQAGSHTYTYKEWEDFLESLRQQNKEGKAMIETTMSMVTDLAPVIAKMSWVIIDAPVGKFFITSDRPVYLTNIDCTRLGAGWENTNALGTLPLSPRRYLMLSYIHPSDTWGYKQASNEEAEFLNERTIASASYAIYSPERYQPAENWLRRAV